MKELYDEVINLLKQADEQDTIAGAQDRIAEAQNGLVKLENALAELTNTVTQKDIELHEKFAESE